MVVKRHAVYATALHTWVWSVFLMKRTPNLSTKPVPVYSMPFQPPRTCLFLAPMCLMPLPRPHLQNRGSSSDRTKPSVNGGRTKTTPPIPDGYVIPVLSAMQGHPKSPRLWEEHANSILRDIGLTPTVHEPCLYSGIINGQHVLFMQQIDDFAIAAPDARELSNYSWTLD